MKDVLLFRDAVEEHLSLPLTSDSSIHSVRIICSGPGEITVKSDGFPIYTGVRNFNKTFQVGSVLEIVGQKKGLYGIEVRAVSRQESEPFDDREIPEKPVKRSLMARIRDEVRRNMALQREIFAENDLGYPGYEVEDEENILWEEEQLAARRAPLPSNLPTQHTDRSDVPEKGKKGTVEPAEVRENSEEGK